MDELIELERAGWASLCDGTGAAFYGRTMTADGLMVLANGSVMTREDVVAALDQAPRWDSFDMNDERVVSVGSDTALLVYLGTGHRAGADPFTGVMSSVYVRRDGSWRLVLYQQTPTQ